MTFCISRFFQSSQPLKGDGTVVVGNHHGGASVLRGIWINLVKQIDGAHHDTLRPGREMLAIAEHKTEGRFT